MQVLWTDGLSLLPHHLQVAEREARQEAWMRDRASSDRAWGVIAAEPLECDAAEVRVRSLLAVLPDGTVLDVPRRQGIPRRALPGPNATGRVSVYLAVAEHSDQRGSVRSSGQSNDAAVRFRLEEVDAQDVHSQTPSAARIHVGVEEVRLVFDGESEAGFVRLKIAELERDVGGQWIERPAYVPPCLRFAATRALPHLVRGLLDRIHGGLSHSNTQRFTALETASPAGGDRLFLWSALLASAHAELRHVMQLGDVAPERVYSFLLGFAAQLSVLHREPLPLDLPAFRHEDLSGAFGGLIARIVGMLDPGVRESFFRIALGPDSGCLSARLPDGVDLERQVAYLYLGGLGAVGGLAPAGMSYIKVGSRDGALETAALSTEGVRLVPEKGTPARLPEAADGVYLRLERQGRRWEDLVRERTVGVALLGAYASLTRAVLYLVPVEQ